MVNCRLSLSLSLNGGILPYVLRQLLEEDSIKQTNHLLDTLQPKPIA